MKIESQESGKWFDTFYRIKEESLTGYEHPFLMKCLNGYREWKKSNGYWWMSLGWIVWVLAGVGFFDLNSWANFGEIWMWKIGELAVLVWGGFVIWLSTRKQVEAEGKDEILSMYLFLEDIKAIKELPRDSWTSENGTAPVKFWNVYFNGYSEDMNQLKLKVECTDTRVSFKKFYNEIQEKAPMFQRWANDRAPEQVWIKQINGRNHEIILDFRNPNEQTSEIYDFLQQGNGLIPWYLPTTEKGNPNGQLALGAIDSGQRYGKDARGFLYQHHFGISGISGYGKSNAIHFLVWQLAQFPNVQIVYVDPNMTDGALWKERACVITKDGAEAVLAAVKEECDRRAVFMEKHGWTKWQSSPGLPQLVIVVDEVKFLIGENKNIGKELGQLLSITRKYGISFILGTQYPKKEYVGGAWENLHYKMSSRLNSDIETQVVFGAKANEAPCAHIKTQGTFYLMDEKNDIERVHIPYVPSEIAVEMANRTSGYKNDKLLSGFSRLNKTQATKKKSQKYGF